MQYEEALKLIGQNMMHPYFGTIYIKDVHQMKDGRILAYHDATICNMNILQRINSGRTDPSKKHTSK